MAGELGRGSKGQKPEGAEGWEEEEEEDACLALRLAAAPRLCQASQQRLVVEIKVSASYHPTPGSPSGLPRTLSSLKPCRPPRPTARVGTRGWEGEGG